MKEIILQLVLGVILGVVLFVITGCGKADFKDKIEDRFETAVFMGDSITEGFSFNKIIPEEQVMAGAGATASYIREEYMDKLVEKKPERIFIMLGSDDLLMPVEDPKGLFIEDFTKLLDEIKEKLPESKIYIQSITPVSKDAIKREPRYKEIDDYNQILKALASNLSVQYVNIEKLVKNDSSAFAEDGIHFKKKFYYDWLEELDSLE